MSNENDRLTAEFREHLRNPNLAIELDRNLFGGNSLIRLVETRTGSSGQRLKPRQLGPVIVGDAGQSHADMLEHLARAMRQAERS